MENAIDASPHRLTTFPVAFPEEEEKTQVNQVLSSLFSKVRSRFTTSTPASPSGSRPNASTFDDAALLSEERDVFYDGLPSSPTIAIGNQYSKSSVKDTSTVHSAPSESSLPGMKSQPTRPSSESASQVISIKRPPALPRSLSNRPAPGPAPPLISTTPVIRTQDFAQYIYQQASGSTDNVSITATGAASPRSPSRTRDRSDSLSYARGHRATGSASSITRFRKPSISGSLTMSSPGSAHLAGSFQSELYHFDSTQIPGFSINDDTRSIYTVDNAGGYIVSTNSRQEKQDAEKIMRRIRGNGINILDRTYWMPNETCKECYDCKSVFSAWRRKHHCRACGQIFCSRCCPNMLPGERFGVSETVRTCNLCLELMNEYDDEDDKRSIISNTTTNLHPPAAPAFLTEQTRPTLGGMHVSEYGHSPFAASQLFRHVNQHDTLSAIQETGFRKRNGSSAVESGSDEELSPPGTPLYDRSRLDMLPYGRAKHPLLNVFPNPSSRPSGESAPFRRAMKEEEAKAGGQGTPQSHEIEFNTKLLEDSGAVTKKASNADPVVAVSEAIVHSVKSPRLDGANIKDDPRNLVGLRTATKPVVSSGENVHPPPMSPTSAETALHTAEVPGSLQSRMSSHVPTSVLSGVLLSENTGSNNMWKERSNTVNEDDDLLKPDSLAYFRLMLGQMLTRDKVPKASQWEDTLTTLLLEIAAIARPPVQNAEDIDIRKYVKIKKLPGGTISQSEYIDGTMITKNLEHKRMERHMSSPRILILTFPIDYHRIDNQLISIEPLLAQENSYLQHLSRRITQLRPHLVLAEKNVSRLALDFLMKSKVAVARGVKSSAIHQVARCTQAEVIVSMDRLALEPKLGRCAEFKVQTYEHRLIPGHRKTYLRFEGCQPRLGCTLLLRGSNIENLKIVKRIADFMILVINNLKMETRLFYEEFNIFPPANPSTIRKPKNTQGGSEFVNDPAAFSTFDSMGRFSLNASTRKTRVEEQEMADRLSLEIEHSLQPYINNAISISVATAYPPPAVLEKMHRLDNRLRELRLVRDETEAAQILLEEGHGVSTPRVSEDGHVRELSGDSTGTMSSTSTLREADRRSSKQIQGIEGDFQPRKFALISLDEIRLECDISQTEFEHAEQLKVWRWYIMRNPPDIRPELFQKLRYRSALSYEGLGKFCTEIDTVTTEFYGPKDQTVGQYLETLCANAGKACANKNCSKLRLQHFEVLLHGATRLRIAIEQFPCPTPDSPITWSYCKVCLQTSPTSAVKEGFWNFSWAKYLEHAFYPPGVVGGFHCAHDAYRDQIRYFSIHNFAIRLFNEPLDVYEVIRPTLTLHVKQESPVLLKNAEYEDITTRSVAFFDSVLLRLRTFDFQLVQPDKVNDLREDLYLMSERANADRSTLHESLERTYLQSAATDALALNAVFEALQDRVVQWDTDFQELDKKYLPSEKDIRRLTASHLKRLFAAQDIFSSIDRSVSGRSAVESEITDQKVDHHRDISSNPEVSVQSEVEKPKISLHTDTPIPTLTLDNPEDITSTPLAENPPDLSRRDTITHKIDETQEREYNSDSTISALPQTALVSSMTPTYCNIDSSTSGRETDIPAFISRLPRRSRPAPSVADLVRRFQSSSQLEMTIDSLRLHMSSPSHSRDRDESDSESESHVRPRLKRGKTDGYNSRTRSSSKVATMSDSGGGYAFNASRIPTLIAARRPVLSDIRRNTASDVPYAQAFEDATPNLALGAPRIQGRTRLARTDFAPSALTPESDMNRRRKADVSNVGKGKAPLRNHLLDVNQAEPRPGTPGFKGNSKRVGTGGGNRVSTIARHFDRLSKEAERDRQRRLNQARGRRARPVGITRAKIHVFSNVRDAFRDGESDSASSKADDEEDGEGDSDVSNSAAKEDDIVAASAEARVSASDNSSDDRSEEIAVRPRAESPPSNFEASSVTPSDTATDLSFKDRLQIALPPFDTSTPLLSVPPTPLLTGQKDTLAPSSQVSEAEGNNTIGHERTSILKTLTNLWAFRSGDATMLEYPLSASEHVFADSRVIVRESEPTSIIAFTLASKTYREKLRSVAQMHREQRRTQATTEGSETSLPEDLKSPSLDESKSTLDSVSRQDIADADEGARREGGTHINYDFDSGNSTISCRIFYAERFAALRSSCGCEDRFIDSLARCSDFDGSGGKSGSAFLKTRDDRFIAKEISRLEMDALTRFAPSYFEYMKESIRHGRPTALAKIYGCFKIGSHNASTGKVMRMNVIIMENLFYERNFDLIYDLKGSTRNRLANTKEQRVLLDENLLEVIKENPLCIKEHSKRVLETALSNDSLFLEGLDVMDYSLVVGVDRAKRELIVGVVDYIRTFTWDKKLESWVKDLGGGGRREPTIVTPKQYRTRFLIAMEKYFTPIPDRWAIAPAQPIKPGAQGEVAQSL